MLLNFNFVDKALGVVTKQRKLVIFALASSVEQDKPANDHHNSHHCINAMVQAKGHPTQHAIENAKRAKEEQGLHRVETDETIISLQQQDSQARSPAKEITQHGGSTRLHAHRSALKRTYVARCRKRGLIILLLCSQRGLLIFILLLLPSSLCRLLVAIWLLL